MYVQSITGPTPGQVTYSHKDQAFDFAARDPAELAVRRREAASLAIDTVLIDVALPSGVLLCVWGYSPQAGWLDVAGSPHSPADGVVLVETDFVPGVSTSLKRDESDAAEVWWTQFDPGSGWCRITSGARDSTCIRIATDTVIGVDEKGVTSVWLKPTFVD